MNRRSFIASLCALPLIRDLPTVKRYVDAAIPIAVLYGNGMHDDTAGLRAWFAGQPVTWADGSAVGDFISNKMFLVSGPIFGPIKRERGVFSYNYIHDTSDQAASAP